MGDTMDDIQAFKEFVKTMPKAASLVHEGKYSWQQLYEMYVLYGENHEIWQQFKGSDVKEANGATFDLGTLLNLLKTIDIDALLSSMQGLEKVLGIAAALFDKEDTNERGFQSISRMDD